MAFIGEELVRRVAHLADKVDLMPDFTWGTVAKVGPLEVRLAGDMWDTPLQADSLVVVNVGDRVLCLHWRSRTIVLAKDETRHPVVMSFKTVRDAVSFHSAVVASDKNAFKKDAPLLAWIEDDGMLLAYHREGAYYVSGGPRDHSRRFKLVEDYSMPDVSAELPSGDEPLMVARPGLSRIDFAVGRNQFKSMSWCQDVSSKLHFTNGFDGKIQAYKVGKVVHACIWINVKDRTVGLGQKRWHDFVRVDADVAPQAGACGSATLPGQPDIWVTAFNGKLQIMANKELKGRMGGTMSITYFIQPTA